MCSCSREKDSANSEQTNCCSHPKYKYRLRSFGGAERTASPVCRLCCIRYQIEARVRYDILNKCRPSYIVRHILEDVRAQNEEQTFELWYHCRVQLSGCSSVILSSVALKLRIKNTSLCVMASPSFVVTFHSK